MPTSPPLRHQTCIRRFQTVKIVRIGLAIARAHAFGQRRSQRDIDCRKATRDRKRRTGEEWKSQTFRIGDHFNAAFPVRREMFVIEDRHTAAAGFEDFDDLFEKLVTGIERLTFLVARVFTVLADDQGAINRQLRAAERQRIPDRLENWRAKALRPRSSKIAFGKLVDVN